MHPSRLPRPVRLALYALAVAILLYLCLAPSEDLPSVEASDRFEHSAAWFVLTATGLILAPRRPRAIVAFAAALGVVVEVLQGLMPLGRPADVQIGRGSCRERVCQNVCVPGVPEP